VFKITTNDENPEFNTVNLCGRFTREYIPEVEKELSLTGTRRKKLALDLAQVTLVDRAAMTFLCAARSKKSLSKTFLCTSDYGWTRRTAKVLFKSTNREIRLSALFLSCKS
jgi:ABC-type transporter Mla MlaB component